MRDPKTLQQAIQYFSNPDNCVEWLAAQRWPDGVVVCPNCGGTTVDYLAKRRVWECRTKHAKRQFSIKVGTIFEDSAIALEKWLLATWMVTNCKNGVSSWEIHRAIGVTQKSAWFMLHRIRLAMQGDAYDSFDGEVEVDETYIGGAARNMHASVRERRYRGGGAGKIAVFGLLERKTDKKHSRVRTHVVPDRWKDTVNEIIKTSVEPGTQIYSDEHGSYAHLADEGFQHAFIRHAEKYVDGAVHTNGIENFWSLLKRGIRGTYVSVEPFHMFRYLDEQAFRFNERGTNDGERFKSVIKQIVNKRLTFKQLTGKSQEAQLDSF